MPRGFDLQKLMSPEDLHRIEEDGHVKLDVGGADVLRANFSPLEYWEEEDHGYIYGDEDDDPIVDLNEIRSRP